MFVVVSAMGKTTNALEAVVSAFVAGERKTAIEQLGRSEEYHRELCCGLFTKGFPDEARHWFDKLRGMLSIETAKEVEYDYWYDRIVSIGELVSTTIVARYLEQEGMNVTWLDIRKNFITDNRHRDANIRLDISTKLLSKAIREGNPETVFITQGFIGATADGQTTTLGREGSDYSAAVAANILNAESLTIWKDVDGILNADPKFFTGTRLIPEMNYLDAIELAYSGAQVIHPKTIKPLQNKNIPLFVRPFGNPGAVGSRIFPEKEGRIDTPVLILKKNQVLISVRPRDFSFVVEDKLPEIFELARIHNIKINLIQSSAVNLSLCVDNCRRLERFGTELRKQGFRVVYNERLELLTIRGYDERSLARHTSTDGIFLVQKTRRNARIVRAETPDGFCLEI